MNKRKQAQVRKQIMGFIRSALDCAYEFGYENGCIDTKRGKKK